MAHLNRKQLAEASKDVFAHNEGSDFYATQDESFFKNELDAKYNTRAVGGKIEVFYREEIEAEQEPAEVEAPAEAPAEVETLPATTEGDLTAVTKPVSKKK